MGIGITASLAHIHATTIAGPWPARVLLLMAAAIAGLFTASWLRHRNPGFFAKDMPAWGMVAMGVLALGGAASGIAGWWAVHAACWATGSVLGVITCLRFLLLLLSRHRPGAAFTWGLPLVAPMVTATSSAQLMHHAGDFGGAIHVWGVLNFALAWVTAVPTFAVAYAKTFPNVPRNFTATAWIPLGLVGQSTAAAQLLAGEHWHTRAALYGFTMLSVGIPLGIYALKHHWGAAFGSPRMAYNPTWWASTFPVGTLCLGTHTLATQASLTRWHLGWLDHVSQALFVLLVLHVLWASIGGVREAITRLHTPVAAPTR